MGRSPVTPVGPTLAVHYAAHGRAEASAFLADATLSARYAQIVDAVWTQSSPAESRYASCSAHPMTIRSSRRSTLLPAVAVDLGDVQHSSRFVEQANGILDEAATQHLRRKLRSGFVSVGVDLTHVEVWHDDTPWLTNVG